MISQLDSAPTGMDSHNTGHQAQSDREIRPQIPLSPREHGVLRLIALGLSNKQIAQELTIRPETVKSHAKNILAKFRAKTRAQAVAHAARCRFI